MIYFTYMLLFLQKKIDPVRWKTMACYKYKENTSEYPNSYMIPKYRAKSKNQKEYVEALYDPTIDLLFCIGPAGTGKTLFACMYGIEQMKQKNIEKIVITRPTISIEENMGFLPGDIKHKMYPWTLPIFDIFREYYHNKEIDTMIRENKIEIAPLGFMQGRTFKNALIIADEMQNSTPLQMFMLLTRIGTQSKIVVTGDCMQTHQKQNGLEDILYKLTQTYPLSNTMYKDHMQIVEMTQKDIQRHPIVETITNLYIK